MLVVDITDVTFIDAVGEEVLSFFGGLGRSLSPRPPIRSTSVSASVFASLRVGRRTLKHRALPAKALANALAVQIGQLAAPEKGL